LDLIGITHKLTEQETGGAYYLFELGFGSESGNRLHVHVNEDEVVYVLEGTIEIRVVDEKFFAESGGIAHQLPGILHALYNPFKTPSNYLAIAIPRRMEQCFDVVIAAESADELND
jgi:uncharacterized cupin superfamily protein